MFLTINLLAASTAEYMLWGFFFGALVGAVVAIYGASKQKLDWGRGGFFACCVSGAILGLILAVPVGAFFVWKISQASSSTVSDESQLRTKCPYCAEIILLDAKVCKHCGRSLP